MTFFLVTFFPVIFFFRGDFFPVTSFPTIVWRHLLGVSRHQRILILFTNAALCEYKNGGAGIGERILNKKEANFIANKNGGILEFSNFEYSKLARTQPARPCLPLVVFIADPGPAMSRSSYEV